MNDHHQKIHALFVAVDELCIASGRNIYVILPEEAELQIPYLKQEIRKCLDLI